MESHHHTWKEFNENPVSHSMAHYLVTLRDLHQMQGYARVSDVAKALEVTKGTVSVQMRQLKEKGLVSEDENRMLLLTTEGEGVVRQVLSNRDTMIQFLHDVLDIDLKQAEVDACKIEHLLSAETGVQILSLVKLLLSDDPQARSLLTKLQKTRKKSPT